MLLMLSPATLMKQCTLLELVQVACSDQQQLRALRLEELL